MADTTDQLTKAKMAENPYTVLGVARSASDDEVRRAYRQLAKTLHPDVNPDDQAAADRFKKVSAAYALLGDKDRRSAFDRGEIDANGEVRRGFSRAGAGSGAGARPGQGPFGGGGASGGAGADEFGFGDIFSDLFGRGGGPGMAGQAPHMRGQDVRYTLEVDFLEAVSGTKKRVTLPEGGMLDLSVPPGVNDGQTLRLKGKGAAGFRGAEPGDALVEIRVRAHPVFRRQGDDIMSELPITIDEAVLGGRIEVQTIEGRVTVTIPKGTSSGRVLRLKGRGIAARGSKAAGDHLVSVKVVLPSEIDDQLSYFISEWRQTHGYDPGRK
ncbi:MAG: DnaJ C-terminal domain-containing protein [Pseudomonadota bacterium]